MAFSFYLRLYKNRIKEQISFIAYQCSRHCLGYFTCFLSFDSVFYKAGNIHILIQLRLNNLPHAFSGTTRTVTWVHCTVQPFFLTTTVPWCDHFLTSFMYVSSDTSISARIGAKMVNKTESLSPGIHIYSGGMKESKLGILTQFWILYCGLRLASQKGEDLVKIGKIYKVSQMKRW